jgi:hypothetical protein
MRLRPRITIDIVRYFAPCGFSPMLVPMPDTSRGSWCVGWRRPPSWGRRGPVSNEQVAEYMKAATAGNYANLLRVTTEWVRT